VAGDHDTIQVDGRMAAGLALGEREGEASLCPVAPPPLLSLFLDSYRLKNIKNLSRAAASTLCLLTFFFERISACSLIHADGGQRDRETTDRPPAD